MALDAATATFLTVVLSAHQFYFSAADSYCGSTQYTPSGQVCCNGQLSPLPSASGIYACCGTVPYNVNTQVCNGQTISSTSHSPPSPVPAPAYDYPYSAQGPGTLIILPAGSPPPYSPPYGGNLVIIPAATTASSPVYYQPAVNYQPSVSYYQPALSVNYQPSYYQPYPSNGGNLIIIPGPAPALPIAPTSNSLLVWCEGYAYIRSTSVSNEQCCGPFPFDPTTQRCQNGTVVINNNAPMSAPAPVRQPIVIYQQQQTTQRYYNPACGTYASSYNPTAQMCCNGVIFNRIGGISCCGSVTYQVSSQFCSNGNVYSYSPVWVAPSPIYVQPSSPTGNSNMCGSTSYNPMNQLCCSGVVYNFYSSSSNSWNSGSSTRSGANSCCGTAGFDSRTQVCCQGSVQPIGSAGC